MKWYTGLVIKDSVGTQSHVEVDNEHVLALTMMEEKEVSGITCSGPREETKSWSHDVAIVVAKPVDTRSAHPILSPGFLYLRKGVISALGVNEYLGENNALHLFTSCSSSCGIISVVITLESTATRRERRRRMEMVIVREA